MNSLQFKAQRISRAVRVIEAILDNSSRFASQSIPYDNQTECFTSLKDGIVSVKIDRI